jgi:fermentation-respiration switch protein FrsA (DUF1100 family)
MRITFCCEFVNFRNYYAYSCNNNLLKKKSVMKKIILFIFGLSLVASTYSQDIKGSWSGVLNTGVAKLRIVIHINEKEGGYTATMDSPDQGAKGIPISAINYENAKLTFSIKNLQVEYEGVWQNDSITGTFKQGGISFPLNLKPAEENSTTILRPQEPKPPYPYHTENIQFENKRAGITLAGTFTYPKEGRNFPVAVLVSGSGPQNRNSEIVGHKPFLVLSDYLTRRGIAVLRFDDRGVAESGGAYITATLQDFAGDAVAAVEYVRTRKEIDPKKVGVIGHSMGGAIAFMLAGEKNNDLAYIVSMAGVSVFGGDNMRAQRRAIATASGAMEFTITQNEVLVTQIQAVIDKYGSDSVFSNPAAYISEALPPAFQGNQQVAQALIPELRKASTPELQSFLKYDPSTALERIKCPVLALNGEKDLQVPADMNLERIGALVKSPVTIKKYPGLNHLFQHCETGLINEYGSIEETISSEALNDIATWITQIAR